MNLQKGLDEFQLELHGRSAPDAQPPAIVFSAFRARCTLDYEVLDWCHLPCFYGFDVKKGFIAINVSGIVRGMMESLVITRLPPQLRSIRFCSAFSAILTPLPPLGLFHCCLWTTTQCTRRRSCRTQVQLGGMRCMQTTNEGWRRRWGKIEQYVSSLDLTTTLLIPPQSSPH